MKGATQCAKRLSSLFRSLRSKLGKVNRPAAGDPISQLILGVFSRDTPESRAREALDRLKSIVVDYNELRVIPPGELADTVGEYPDVRLKCEDVNRALNRIFGMEHTVSLDRLTDAPKSDVIAYLAGIPGLEAYTRARMRLLAFNHHAIPLDEAMWAYARQEEIIDARCTLEEAHSFLERHVEDGEALEFFALLRKAAWNELATQVRRGEVEHIRSVPPDRTSRNMLRLIQSGGQLPEAEPNLDDLAEDEFPGTKEEVEAPSAKSGKKSKSTKRRPESRAPKPKPAKKRAKARSA